LARLQDYPQLQAWLKDRRWSALLDFCDRQPRAVTFLTALTYDQDPLVSWRAVEAVGLAAGRIAEKDPERVRGHLRRLLWSLNDESGGIGWRAPETIGEILYNCQGKFEEFVPLVLSLLDMEAQEDAVRFRPGVLWAIGRIAPLYPNVGDQALPRLIACLRQEDSRIIGMALWCLYQMKNNRSLPLTSSMLEDERCFQVYECGEIHWMRISKIVRELAPESF
jgi:hypothetical protein